MLCICYTDRINNIHDLKLLNTNCYWTKLGNGNRNEFARWTDIMATVTIQEAKVRIRWREMSARLYGVALYWLNVNVSSLSHWNKSFHLIQVACTHEPTQHYNWIFFFFVAVGRAAVFSLKMHCNMQAICEMKLWEFAKMCRNLQKL